jgi:hypothetical protein
MRLGTSSTEEGLPLTIAATHLDGLVLSLTPNSHSYNYRSSIIHGRSTCFIEPVLYLFFKDFLYFRGTQIESRVTCLNFSNPESC